MTEKKEFVLEDWVEDGLKGLISCFPREFMRHMVAAC